MSDYRTIEEIAGIYTDRVRHHIAEHGQKVRLCGILASENAPSVTYAKYTRSACEKMGIEFELRSVSQDELIDEVEKANKASEISGIMIYYPVFFDDRDNALRNIINPYKDIEGLSSFWTDKLYLNVRTYDGDPNKKAILPCTPLAVTKVVENSPLYSKGGRSPLEGRVVSVFNRSDVVGRPLAAMLANDGAIVYSFDESGVVRFLARNVEPTEVSRAEALLQSDIVITGVPSKSFEKIRGEEIKPGALCINFSTVQNFDEDIEKKAVCFYRKVGPVTIAMCMRNALRLAKNVSL